MCACACVCVWSERIFWRATMCMGTLHHPRAGASQHEAGSGTLMFTWMALIFLFQPKKWYIHTCWAELQSKNGSVSPHIAGICSLWIQDSSSRDLEYLSQTLRQCIQLAAAISQIQMSTWWWFSLENSGRFLIYHLVNHEGLNVQNLDQGGWQTKWLVFCPYSGHTLLDPTVNELRHLEMSVFYSASASKLWMPNIWNYMWIQVQAVSNCTERERKIR